MLSSGTWWNWSHQTHICRWLSCSLPLWVYQDSSVSNNNCISSRQIPLTWTHRITQYSPPEEDHTVYVDDPISFDYTSLGKVFNVIISFISNIKVVFLNTPPNYDFTCFSQLSLPRKLVPTGFVFVWADKENIIEIFENKGFYYVENLVWVQSHDEDMKALHETTPTLLRRSKRTLLILRRGRRLANGSITYDPIDMRHQRHPDVIISPYSTYSGEKWIQWMKCRILAIAICVWNSRDIGSKRKCWWFKE